MATSGKAAAAPEVATPSGPVDLTNLIDKKSIVCMNQSSSNPIGNALNDELTQLHYGSATPGYARRSLNSEYGSSISLGIKGRY